MTPPPPPRRPATSILTPDLRDRLRRHSLLAPATTEGSPPPPGQTWGEPPAAHHTGSDLASDGTWHLLACARERRAEAAEATLAEGGGGATPPDAAWRHLELRLAGETARADAADAARAELEARVVAAAPVVCPPLTAEAGTWTGEGGDDEVETESEGGQQTRASLLASLEAALDEERRAAAGARVDVAASAASAEAARAEAAHWRREVVAAVAAATLECALESASGAAAAVKEALAKAERARVRVGVEVGVQAEVEARLEAPPALLCAPTPPTSRAASPEARPLRARQQGQTHRQWEDVPPPTAAHALAGLRAISSGAARLSAGGRAVT